MKESIVRSRKIDKKKVVVVRNWQNDKKFLDVYGTSKNENPKFVFMFLGNLSPSTGIETFIHAFGKAKLLNCKLIIAGEGSDKQNCQRIASLYSSENIEFIPAPVEQVPFIQQQADVLVLTLRKGMAKTATPSKLTAYMFSGKPILACVDPDSDTADCILKSNCGFVVEPENQEKLLELIKNIVNCDKTILDQFGKNSITYARANLSREVNLKIIISLIID
jgi:glycosyltransferase involved in cell wall biosynthesis